MRGKGIYERSKKDNEEKIRTKIRADTETDTLPTTVTDSVAGFIWCFWNMVCESGRRKRSGMASGSGTAFRCRRHMPEKL